MLHAELGCSSGVRVRLASVDAPGAFPGSLPAMSDSSDGSEPACPLASPGPTPVAATPQAPERYSVQCVPVNNVSYHWTFEKVLKTELFPRIVFQKLFSRIDSRRQEPRDLQGILGFPRKSLKTHCF